MPRGIFVRTKETKEKIRQANIIKNKSLKQREKVKQSNLGNKYSLGKKRTTEQKEHYRQAGIERFKNPEEIKKQRLINLGRKRTPEQIENNRQAQIRNGKNRGKNNSMYGKTPKHGKGTWYETPQGKIFLKSSWELAYAKYLDSIGEEYYYEPSAFCMNINGKDTTYTPDFYLPNKGKFVEVKGYWRDDAKAKFDYFSNIPEINEYFGYELLMKDDLQKLGVL